jgi:glucosylceramidase
MNERSRRPSGSLRTWILSGLAVLAVGTTVVLFAMASSEPETSVRPAPVEVPAGVATGATTTSGGGDRMRTLDVRTRSSTGELDIFVDHHATSQRIEGFGAAMTHSSAALLSDMSPHERTALLEELFAPDGTARLTVLRLPIGASDFVDGDAFTFNDLPPGETDWGLDRFTIEPDRQAMIPMLQEALAINPDLRLIASPWSPPAWMKTGGSLEGGRLLDEARAYETYARYLVRFVEEYRAEGLDIDYLTVQNEPQLRHPDGYPATDMPFWQAARLIEALGPMLEAAGLDTRILGFDHNWELNPADAATTPPGEDPAYLYPADLLRTAADEWIDGIAFHCYSGRADAQTRLWEQFPDIEIWVTECSGSRAADDSPEKAFADTLAWQSTNLLIDALRNRASGVLTWNLVLDEFNGPHRGGCGTCSGVVTVASDGSITRNAEYYLLAHAARYLPPGSVRLESASLDAELRNVAFLTPDGATVLIVWNPSTTSRDVSIGDADWSGSAELPAASLSTISWSAPPPSS